MRLSLATLGIAVLAAAAVSGCASTDDARRGTASTAPSPTATDSTSPGPPEGTLQVSSALFDSADPGSSVRVGPRRGGTVEVTLADGTTVTLTIPEGAVDHPVIVRLVPFHVDGVDGVLLEPAGLWLARPAMLTASAGAVLTRSAMADGRVAFVSAPRTADDEVPIVRLRPVAIVAATDRDETVAGEGGADPLDGLASRQELAEAEDPGRGTDGDAEAATTATSQVAEHAPQCGNGATETARVVVEAWRTAGGTGAPPAACSVLRASVLAAMEADWSQGRYQPWQEVVHATGSGPSVDGVADIDMPATREISSFAQYYSLLFTGAAEALGEGEMREDACSTSAIPQGSVRLETVPLPDDQVRVTLTPDHGTYSITCDGQEYGPVGSLAWETIADILGIAEGAPISIAVPAREQVTYVLAKAGSYEGAAARHGADGSVTYRGGGQSLNANLAVDLAYEPVR